MALNPDQLKDLAERIESRCRALVAELQSDAERARAESFREVAGPVTDSGDEANADLVADLDNAELSRDLRELRGLQAARERLERGRYGKCADCGAEIPFERLRAEPAALRCIECQRRYEKTHAGPGEPKL